MPNLSPNASARSGTRGDRGDHSAVEPAQVLGERMRDCAGPDDPPAPLVAAHQILFARATSPSQRAEGLTARSKVVRSNAISPNFGPYADTHSKLSRSVQCR